MPESWILPFCFMVSAIGVGLTLLHARRAGIVDVPNHRSSHTIPTPHGGGLALVAAVLAATSIELGTAPTDYSLYVAILGIAVAGLGVIGLLDDRGHVPVALRLPIHVACGLAVALLVNA